MPVIWDNPMGYSFIATRQCRSCDHDQSVTLWSRPWDFANEEFAKRLPETPLTMPEVANMLRDAPFTCKRCDDTEARLVGMALDEGEVLF
ncbi:hypothetical protein [Methylobacterium sp. J-092]|uniref:hypothetical protein n=1 Tax=Methylobacterium sp. J-092 TaxID=2836667 RepID=UPI001FB9956C|nr:hypothetical protein [Methylobacterium sp. J-092]MCJ2009773.1 hypothetical protein [Methylobacterium sp. J-092]